MNDNSIDSKFASIKISCCRKGVKQSDIWLPAEKCVPEKELRHFIKSLSPKAVGYDLTRIGRNRDGGYLAPDDLEGIQACFSPGGGRSTFEETLAVRYGIKSFIAEKDEIEMTQVARMKRFIRQLRKHKTFCLSLNFDIENKYIGVENNLTTIRLHDWMRKKVQLDSIGDLILQMDIEGDEMDILMDTSPEALKKFRIMVIEFHLMMLYDLSVFSRFKGVFNKILSDFCVVHIHPNNGTAIHFYQGIEIPLTMEFTFIRKDRVLPDNRKLVFPHKLDCRNNPNVPDLVLPEIWQNHKTW